MAPFVTSRGCLTCIFALSALGKVFKVANGGLDGGHPSFGSSASNIYPAWFLPIAVATEVAAVLLLWIDEPFGHALACTFIGGVCFTQTLHNGPAAEKGPAMLFPAVSVAGCLMYSLLNREGARNSSLLGSKIPLAFFAACVAVGCGTGKALLVIKAKTAL